MHASPIPLTISTGDYTTALDTLERRGSFNIKPKFEPVEIQGSSVLFKRVGLWDRFRALFLSDSQRTKRADQVTNHFKTILNIKADDHWLLHNIREKVKANGLIDGQFLAENIRAFRHNCKVDFDCKINARRSGLGVGLANAAPEKVYANRQVASFEQARDAASMALRAPYNPCDVYSVGHHQEGEVFYNENFPWTGGAGWPGAFGEGNGRHSRRQFASKILVMLPPTHEFLSRGINTPESFFQKLSEHVTWGSVVMEPLPDDRFGTDVKHAPTPKARIFSDDCLKAQLAAAHAVNRKKFANRQEFVITFATSDSELFKRLHRLNAMVEKEMQAVQNTPSLR